MTFIHKTPSVTDFVIFLLTSQAPLRRSFASKQYFVYKATVSPAFLVLHTTARERDPWQYRTDIGLINCTSCEVFYGQFVINAPIRSVLQRLWKLRSSVLTAMGRISRNCRTSLQSEFRNLVIPPSLMITHRRRI